MSNFFLQASLSNKIYIIPSKTSYPNTHKGCLQNKNRSYFVFPRQGVGGRAAKIELSRKSRKWAIFLLFHGKKSLIFRGFWDKGWGGGRQFCSYLEKTKYERFFFASIPNVGIRLVEAAVVKKNVDQVGCLNFKKNQRLFCIQIKSKSRNLLEYI